MISTCAECKARMDDRVDVRFTIHDGPALCSWKCVFTYRLKKGLV